MTPAELAERLRGVGRDRLVAAVRKEVVKAGLRAEGAAKELAGSRMQVRSGALRRSIQSSVTDEDGGFALRLRAGAGSRELRYARIHEEGGEIIPKNGKFLAIPWPGGPAVTAGGVSRYASPRDVPDLHFQATRGGAGGLLLKDIPGKGKNNRSAKSEIWYVLVRKVNIKAKRYLGDAMDPERERLSAHLQETLAHLLGEGGT